MKCHICGAEVDEEVCPFCGAELKKEKPVLKLKGQENTVEENKEHLTLQSEGNAYDNSAGNEFLDLDNEPYTINSAAISGGDRYISADNKDSAATAWNLLKKLLTAAVAVVVLVLVSRFLFGIIDQQRSEAVLKKQLDALVEQNADKLTGTMDPAWVSSAETNLVAQMFSVMKQNGMEMDV